MTPERQLSSFLAKFNPKVRSVARAVLAKMRARLPTANVLVYDNFNALAVGFAPGEKAGDGIFSIAVYPRWVTLFFLQGKGLNDPKKVLRGEGKRVRHLVLGAPSDLDLPAVRALIGQALRAAKTPLDPKNKRRVLIKSVSARQRPRRPAQ